MLDSRLFHFIKKEFIQLLRDPRMLFIALMAPVIQLIVFGYIASTDINHISTVILDEDKSYYSRNYLQSYKNSGYFDFNYYVARPQQIADLIDSGRAKLGLRIAVNFGRKIVRGDTASVQAVIDGSNSSTAAIIQGYINQINFGQVEILLRKKIEKAGSSARNLEPIMVNSRIWYNPELKSLYYMVPAIFAQILMIISMLLTSTAIIKEKERGTMEMLAVTPLKSYELILGKLLPFVIIALFDIVLVLLIATLWFNVWIKGSVFDLFYMGVIFMLTGLGLGIFISTISQTQRQAMMTVIFIILPQIIISGFIFPIANMPKIIQLITYLIPLRYFLEIVRNIFLKGVGINYLWYSVWPMVVFGVVILSLSIIRFRKKID